MARMCAVACLAAAALCAAGCVSKGVFDKQVEITQQIEAELDALRAEVGDVRREIEPLVVNEQPVERTNRAFIRSLRIQGSAARSQADQIDDLVRELERETGRRPRNASPEWLPPSLFAAAAQLRGDGARRLPAPMALMAVAARAHEGAGGLYGLLAGDHRSPLAGIEIMLALRKRQVLFLPPHCFVRGNRNSLQGAFPRA